MDVGPYVPLPRRAVEKRCYLKDTAMDEAVVYSFPLSFGLFRMSRGHR